MKNIAIIIILIVICGIFFVGCDVSDLLIPVSPEIVNSEMEALAKAKLVKGEEDLWNIEWSVVNIGNVDIELYILTFDVYYPINAKDNVIVETSGGNLEVGEFHQGKIELLGYGSPDIPEEVSVTWKLY